MATVFIDANIVLDFLDSARPRHTQAVQSLATLAEQGYTPVVTEDLLTTIYYVAEHKIRILEFFTYMLHNWVIVPFGLSILEHTIADCRQDSSIDFEDRAQGYAALRQNCHFLLTADKNFAAPPGLSICGMQEILSASC